MSTKLSNFRVGDKISFPEGYNCRFPKEYWNSEFGCPPLPAGTKGEVIKKGYHYLTVAIKNPITGRFSFIPVMESSEIHNPKIKKILDGFKKHLVN